QPAVLLSAARMGSLLIDAKPSPLPIHDPDNQWVLASAVDGQGDLLVTGDQDLLAIADWEPLAIVDPRGCWDRLRQ
ncbi:MAG: hypothetical protein ACXWWB_11645, partial [Nitrospira sp.]